MKRAQTSKPGAERAPEAAAGDGQAALLRVLAQALPVGVVAIDAAGRHPSVNPAFCRMVDWPAAELLQASAPFPYWPEEQREAIQAALQTAQREGRPVESCELRFQRRSGERFDALVNIVPLRLEGSEAAGCLATVWDISPRKQAEAALRQDAERLRFVLEATRVGTWDWNVQSGELHWSGNMDAVHGLPPGTLGPSLDGFLADIHETDRPRVQAAIEHALQTGEYYQIEYCLAERPDRPGRRWVEGQGRVWYDEQGKPVRMAGICMDVTRRRLADEQFRMAVEASPSGVILTDEKGRIILVNRQAEDLFGYAREELIDQSVELLVPEAVRERHRGERRGFFSDMRARPMGAGRDLFARRKDGSEFPVEIGLNPIRVESGLWVLASVTDITERKRAEAKLQEQARRLAEAGRHKDEFLALLGHELRNPLAPISNAVQVLRLQKEVQHPTLDWGLDVIERQLGHLTRLVDDLMDTSRIARGKLKLARQDVDLVEVVRLAAEGVQPLIAARGHSLELDLPAQPLRLRADPGRLSQVVANLLTNAARYTPEGGTIQVRVQQTDDRASIAVRDNGVGIPGELLPHIFDGFRQGERPQNQAGGGLGLGLNLVRRLVEMHGGSVEASSAGPGAGSEFRVHLPLAHGAASRAPAVAAPLPACRVLVVDDDPQVAASFAMLLGSLGQDVRTASDGPTALGIAGSWHPQLVLLDLRLPGMDGFEVARRLRRSTIGPAPLLVAMSGLADAQDMAHLQAAGFDRCVPKPSRLTDLEALLAACPAD